MLDILAIGDLHFDGLKFLPDGNSLIRDEIAKVEKYAIRNGIQHVVYLGDIADKPVLSYEAHEMLLDVWGKNQDLLTRHVILGNHDYSHVGRHSLTILKKAFEGSNVHIYTEPTKVDIGGISVNFLPYPFPNIEDDIELTGCVNVSHFEVAGAMRDNGTPSTAKYQPPSRTHWVMGHLHTPHDVGLVHYVGTMFQRNFGESLPKSFSRVKARLKDGELQLKKTRIENHPSFQLSTIVAERASDLESVPYEPTHFVKLLVSSKLHLPADYLSSRPNIVKVQVFATKSERKALVEDSVITSVDILDFDAFDRLGDYLSNYYPNLTDDELSRIHTIMGNVRRNLEGG